jgi:hypothetical protein
MRDANAWTWTLIPALGFKASMFPNKPRARCSVSSRWLYVLAAAQNSYLVKMIVEVK